ncbi:hypothetical protein Q3G72_010720 [Acer saccharum]|nr:hypothetical protein Q3G72_010720 [Acer saccharum]
MCKTNLICGLLTNLTGTLTERPRSALLDCSSLHSPPQKPIHHRIKRERLSKPAPWERIRLGTSLISSNEEKEVPLVRNKNSKVDEVDVVSQGSESYHFDCWEEVPTVHVPQALPLVLRTCIVFYLRGAPCTDH